MEWLNIIITSICSIIGIIGGGVGIYFWKENKDGKKIDNEKSLSEGWQNLYRQVKDDNEAKDKRIDELFEKYNSLQDSIINTKHEMNEMKLEIVRLKEVRCYAQNCPKRKFNLNENEE